MHVGMDMNWNVSLACSIEICNSKCFAVYEKKKCESNAIKLEKTIHDYTSRAMCSDSVISMWIVFAADTRQFIYLFIVQIRISLVPICAAIDSVCSVKSVVWFIKVIWVIDERIEWNNFF